MSNAICGKSCSVTIGSQAYDAHQFSIARQANEIDVTGFGSGDYGDWLACSVNGTITVQCYDLPVLAPGDAVTVVTTFGYTSIVTITFTNAKVTSFNSEVDAKGIVAHTVVCRIVGDPTIGS